MKSFLTHLFLLTLVFVQVADKDRFQADQDVMAISHDAGGALHLISESDCAFHSGCHSLQHMYVDTKIDGPMLQHMASSPVSTKTEQLSSTLFTPPVPPPLA